MPTTSSTITPILDLYEIGETSTPDSWLISDWAAGQTNNMNWSDENVVSATSRPYAVRLDGCACRQGMRSSMRDLGCPSRMARRVSAR